MPKYILRNGKEQRASLELEGWQKPQNWIGDTLRPLHWPETSILSLIKLFNYTNTSTEKRESIEIPEVLAWHIAVLIEAWETAPGNRQLLQTAQEWYAQGIQVAAIHHARIQSNRAHDVQLRTNRS